MSAPLKSPNKIRLKQINYDNLTETPSDPVMISLAEKIEDFVMRLGFSNGHTSSIVAQLMSVGKIRVDFRDHAERLQLTNPADLMSKPEAVAMCELFIEQLHKKTGHGELVNLEMTQRIIVQPPKPIRPEGT